MRCPDFQFSRSEGTSACPTACRGSLRGTPSGRASLQAAVEVQSVFPPRQLPAQCADDRNHPEGSEQTVREVNEDQPTVLGPPIPRRIEVDSLATGVGNDTDEERDTSAED